ncbi:MAG: cyclopropane-fatty-acyl-phospholipid synthase family protein [Halieaceae bacterium]
MNDVSVRAIRLPQLRSTGLGNNMARRAIHQLLQSIKIGSLTLHDGGETLHFGCADNPAEPHAEIRVHSELLYKQMLLGGALGAGESYMQGEWSATDLVQVIRLFTANMALLESMDAKQSWLRKLGHAIAHTLNNNTLRGSKRNISAHYDLGNDFFELFLDQSMMYSAAVFPQPEASLEVAAEHKLDLLCQQLDLKPGDHLLEIGTGWGGMAIHAARNYGCQVTTTTISREQYQYACEKVRQAGLEDQITLLCEDYRNLEGSYDKLVSVEMIEAVGHRFYQNYFAKCSSLLKDQGLMVIQAITMPDQRYQAARDSVDFIKRYIFPGGCLPSIEVISKHLRQDTDMQMIHLRDITDDYANTLAHWRERFFEHIEEVRRQGFDQTFERMWEFYLCYCEGGFRERVIGTVQLTFAKPGYRFG